ncbi:MAG: hypothetical protein MI974_26010 [Chitinophagales bacterium]|nr:hypothetical protein [Chitinophagales bacterium]
MNLYCVILEEAKLHIWLPLSDYLGKIEVMPYSTVGGNQAKEIRKRFSDEEIAHLSDIKWRDWEPEKISQNLHKLTRKQIFELK